MFPKYRATIFLKPHKRTHIINRSIQTSSDKYIKCIEKYAKDRSLMLGKALHAHLLVNGGAWSRYIASKLIKMYVECGELAIARQVFDKMPHSNYHRWIVLIGAYAKCGFYRQALNLLREMLAQGLKPNNYVLPSGLKACGNLSKWRVGEEIHGFIVINSYGYDLYVGAALIDMYSKCGFVDKARKVFENMIEKDVFTVNSMIAGYVHAGNMTKALNVVEDVERIKVRPDIVTWNTLIAGFSKTGNSVMVDKLFRAMSVNGMKPDVVSWTSVITGFVKNFKNEEAFFTFQKMLNCGCLPNTNTISILLSACANVANERWGKEIHGFALVAGLEQDLYVQSALIDMYSKCGYIFQASTLFQKMNRRDTPTWNSMILGFANHGYCTEAIELFRRMEAEEPEKLDYLTFIAVLTACSYGGMEDLGRNLFEMMNLNYNIKPRLEHYACMVDLLGRAGKLTEAHELIKAMPIEPDLFVWGALLGACKQHGEIELAEVAAEHLSKLEPLGSGTNTLSSLYAGAGSWENAARMKKLMKKKKIKFKSFSGRSWLAD